MTSVHLRLTIEEAETLHRLASAAWEETDIVTLLAGEPRVEASRIVRVIDKLAASINRAKAKGSNDS